MPEATRKILAYQKGPMILLCHDAGSIPQQFLASLSADEKQYLASRCDPGLFGVVEKLLSRLGAAGIAPTTTPLLVDALHEQPVVSDSIDSVFFPLAADESTQKWLAVEIGNSFRSDVRELVKKTSARFGHAQLVVLSVLPRFIDGKMVSDEFVCFGEQILDSAVESPLYASERVDPRGISSLCTNWSWIGIHPKFFSSQSLQEQLTDKLTELKVSVVAQ